MTVSTLCKMTFDLKNLSNDKILFVQETYLFQYQLLFLKIIFKRHSSDFVLFIKSVQFIIQVGHTSKSFHRYQKYKQFNIPGYTWIVVIQKCLHCRQIIALEFNIPYCEGFLAYSPNQPLLPHFVYKPAVSSVYLQGGRNLKNVCVKLFKHFGNTYEYFLRRNQLDLYQSLIDPKFLKEQQKYTKIV